MHFLTSSESSLFTANIVRRHSAGLTSVFNVSQPSGNFQCSLPGLVYQYLNVYIIMLYFVTKYGLVLHVLGAIMNAILRNNKLEFIIASKILADMLKIQKSSYDIRSYHNANEMK